jgi:hypothetical protein
MTRHAEDPFLIGRELITQGCDWPNENLVSIPVKEPKLFQGLLSFPWSTRKKWFFPFRSRIEKVLKFCPLAEKRGSLEGVRERDFKDVLIAHLSWPLLAIARSCRP